MELILLNPKEKQQKHHFTIRLDHDIFIQLPEANKAKTINKILREYQEGYTKSKMEDMEQKIYELEEESSRWKEELVKFFLLFQKNAENLMMDPREIVHFEDLLQELKNHG